MAGERALDVAARAEEAQVQAAANPRPVPFAQRDPGDRGQLVAVICRKPAAEKLDALDQIRVDQAEKSAAARILRAEMAECRGFGSKSSMNRFSAGPPPRTITSFLKSPEEATPGMTWIARLTSSNIPGSALTSVPVRFMAARGRGFRAGLPPSAVTVISFWMASRTA